MRLAIFDFDGTLLRGNSWHLFFGYALRARPWRAPDLLAALGLRRCRVLAARCLQERVLGLWRGCSPAEQEELGRVVHDRWIKPALRAAGLAELRRCRDEGLEIVLVTGAFDFLVRPFVEEQSIRFWRATRPRFDAGVFSGCLAEDSLRGPAKVAALRELLADRVVDWPGSRAYGDEASDLPLLGLVGEPRWVESGKPVPRTLPAGTDVLDWRPRRGIRPRGLAVDDGDARE